MYFFFFFFGKLSIIFCDSSFKTSMANPSLALVTESKALACALCKPDALCRALATSFIFASPPIFLPAGFGPLKSSQEIFPSLFLSNFF